MAKITGILVNVTEGTAKQVTIDATLDSYYSALNCDCIDIVTRRIGDTLVDIICDDEALLKPNPRPSAINLDGSVSLCGNLLLCSHDGNGNEVSLPDGIIAKILDLNTRRIFSTTHPNGEWLALYPCMY